MNSKRFKPLNYLIITTVLISSGCSTVNNLMDNDQAIDYKSSKTANKLEVPPDLTQMRSGFERYDVAKTVSASSLNAASQPSLLNNAVLPQNIHVRMEHTGNTRYVVVDLPVERVYPVLLDFWKDSGFTLAVDSPQTGIIETDWAENRSKTPASGLRKMLGGVIDGLFDSGERDKYRTRIERAAGNSTSSTEIYLTHRGTKEVSSDNPTLPEIKTINRDGSIDLEVDFLRRIMLRLGANEQFVQTATNSSIVKGVSAPVIPDKARFSANKDALELDDTYDVAWRRVGLALDRSGFTVQDRNYSTGEYFINYARNPSNNEAGFFSRLFSSKPKDKDIDVTAQGFKLVLQRSTPTLLALQFDKGGKPDVNFSKSLLGVLREELK